MDTRDFQSAPYYQQERAKTFFRRVEMVWAKLVKEVDYQLEQRHKRSDEVVINVEEDEGSESPQESTTVAVYVSRWERLKRRVLNFPPMSVYAGRILENQHFSRLIIFFIMLNTVLLGVQAEISDKPDMSLANEVLNGINW
ncbi:hypothetical protein SRHO_G00326650, partial [Serrasalmus rhombeus]